MFTSHHIHHIIKSSDPNPTSTKQSTLPSYSTSNHQTHSTHPHFPMVVGHSLTIINPIIPHMSLSFNYPTSQLLSISPSQLPMGMTIDLFQFSHVPHSFMSASMACSALFMCCCEGVEIIISSTHNPILPSSSTQSETGMSSILFSIKQTTGLMGSGNKRGENKDMLDN